jgi:hypothetical protein
MEYLAPLASYWKESLTLLALYWKESLAMTLAFSLTPVFLVYLFEFLKELFTRTKTRRPRGKVSSSWRTDPKNRNLQSHLLNLLQGDVPTAKRLLQYQRQMNPGKSDNWYLEKVIWDLERDRGR